MSVPRILILLAALVSGSIWLSGCAVYVPAPSREVVVQSEPPAPLVEVVPVAPGPAFIWIGGFWEWHERWVWTPGRWVERPNPNANWVEPRWERREHDWRFHGGHWR